MDEAKELLLRHPLLAGQGCRARNWTRENIFERFWTYQVRVAQWVTFLEVDTDLEAKEMLLEWNGNVCDALLAAGRREGWEPWLPEYLYFGMWVTLPLRPTLDLASVFSLSGELLEVPPDVLPGNFEPIEDLAIPPVMRVRNLQTNQSIVRPQ